MSTAGSSSSNTGPSGTTTMAARPPSSKGTSATSKGKGSSSSTPAAEETNIQVVVRCRPMSAAEMVECKGNSIIECNEEAATLDVVQMVARKKTTKTYTYDKVFGSDTTQEHVYEEVVMPMVADVLEGYNATIFAYGQTGTGKTFTMTGDVDENTGLFKNSVNAGIIPRCIENIFHQLDALNAEYTVRVSYLELYNEELIDLLAIDQNNLRIFEDAKRGTFVHNLEETPVNSSKDIYNILKQGTAKRVTAATAMNHQSSRSHTIFSITVHIKEQTAEGEDLVKIGKLHLVDLAGSENIGRSGAVSQRAREAGLINQSLLTLGRVINALVASQSHIPYRESKLTRLLQDSLGGRTKTCIVATISPALSNMEETASTLEYAHRAKNIKNRPEVNQKMTTRAAIKDYTEEIETLRSMLKAAREKDGVYLSNDQYTKIQEKMTDQTTKIEELEASLETAQKSLDGLNDLLNKTSASLTSTKAKLESTETTLATTIGVLEGTKSELSKTQVALKETTVLVDSHVVAEEDLAGEAASLLSTVVQTKTDISLLHSKIERKAGVVQENFKTVSTFESAIGGELKAIASSLNTFDNSAANDFVELSEVVASFTKAQTEVLSHFSSSLAGLAQDVSTQMVTLKAALSSDLQERETFTGSVKDTSGAASEAALEETSRFFTNLSARLATTMTALESQATMVAAWQARVQSGLEAVKESASSFVASTNESLLKMDAKVTSLVADHVSDLEAIKVTMANNLNSASTAAAAQEASLLSSISTLLAQAFSTNAAVAAAAHANTSQALTLLATKVTDGGSELSSMTNTLATASQSYGSEVVTKVANLTGSAAHFTQEYETAKTNMEDSLMAFGEEAQRFVSQAKESTAASSLALSAVLAAENERAGLATASAMTDMAALTNQVSQSTSAMVGLVDGASTAAESFQTSLQASLEKTADSTSTYLNATIDSINSVRDNALSLSSNLKEDTPTGSTPMKRDYSHVSSFTRTRPHEEIIAEFRAATGGESVEVPAFTLPKEEADVVAASQKENARNAAVTAAPLSKGSSETKTSGGRGALSVIA